MKPILDATAGYRMMWRNKNPPNVVFMDKKTEVNPHIVAVWGHLPFRDNVFSLIIFDPPHIVLWRTGTPQMAKVFGGWNTPKEIAPTLHKAAKEFSRVGEMLVLKWCDTRDGSTWWKLSSLFRGHWTILYERSSKSKGTGHGLTWWITFTRTPPPNPP